MKSYARTLAILALVFGVAAPAVAQDASDPEAKISYAESAGIPEIASEATILDANGDVIREGSNGWTCMYIPDAPMCLDRQWMAALGAMMSGSQEFVPTTIGISYMLQGDAGASNTDPFASGPTETNDWVVTGPHVMIISPDPATLADVPTEPSGGGPYVMWAGTPYAHVMIPLEADAVSMPSGN